MVIKLQLHPKSNLDYQSDYFEFFMSFLHLIFK